MSQGIEYSGVIGQAVESNRITGMFGDLSRSFKGFVGAYPYVAALIAVLLVVVVALGVAHGYEGMTASGFPGDQLVVHGREGYAAMLKEGYEEPVRDAQGNPVYFTDEKGVQHVKKQYVGTLATRLEKEERQKFLDSIGCNKPGRKDVDAWEWMLKESQGDKNVQEGMSADYALSAVMAGQANHM